MVSQRSNYHHNNTQDPASILARGYTARYLGAVLKNTFTGLTQDEIERDLRHMSAYHEAATRYHQLTYASTNRLPLQQTDPQSSFPAVLPVTIDPEEEKRAVQQRKRIARAECVREELEQQYVSLRAHYVLTTQQLQHTQQDSTKTLELLQSIVRSTATSLGWQRARLQMGRDILHALQVRIAATAGTTALDPTVHAAGADSCPMVAQWVMVEDELKKMYHGRANPAAKTKKAMIVPWNCTEEPATASGVPILVSALSTAPEKSVAVATGRAFGAARYSMLWLEQHLPDPSNEEEEEDENVDVLECDSKSNHQNLNQVLESEVNFLEKELQREREVNQSILTSSGKARSLHDEWVAMIALVRQETESVLHRHNILLESDEVQDALAAAEDEEDEEEELEEYEEEEIVEETSEVTQEEERGDVATATGEQPLDEAADADDEGLAEDAEDEEHWNNGKRGAAEDGEEISSSRSKRRKV